MAVRIVDAFRYVRISENGVLKARLSAAQYEQVMQRRIFAKVIEASSKGQEAVDAVLAENGIWVEKQEEG